MEAIFMTARELLFNWYVGMEIYMEGTCYILQSAQQIDDRVKLTLRIGQKTSTLFVSQLRGLAFLA